MTPDPATRAQELERPFGAGTLTRRVGPVALNCMDPEYRACLNRVMETWRAHWAELPPPHRKPADPDDVYSFAYWLIRWSGLVMPARPWAPQEREGEGR